MGKGTQSNLSRLSINSSCTGKDRVLVRQSTLNLPSASPAGLLPVPTALLAQTGSGLGVGSSAVRTRKQSCDCSFSRGDSVAPSAQGSTTSPCPFGTVQQEGNCFSSALTFCSVRPASCSSCSSEHAETGWFCWQGAGEGYADKTLQRQSQKLPRRLERRQRLAASLITALVASAGQSWKRLLGANQLPARR